MNGDDSLRAVYLVGCLVIVASALAARRFDLRQGARMALAWVAIFAIGFLLFAYRDELGALTRSIAGKLDPEAGTVTGGSLSVPMAEDGHFWVRGTVNGMTVRFLIDSGATTTALSGATVRDAGIAIDPDGLGQAIATANGTVVARRVRVGTLALGPIARHDLAAVTASEFGGTNVLGMNFLSTLSRWGVEGKTLVLQR